MKSFITYDDSGRITTYGKCTAAEFEQLTVGYNLVMEIDDATVIDPLSDYVEAGKVQRRPATDNPPLLAVPASVTMRQARLALLGAGMLQTISAALNAMPGDEGESARIEWEYATQVDRHSPLVASMTAVMQTTDAAIDQLFIHAATL